jgi:hypothetical protein
VRDLANVAVVASALLIASASLAGTDPKLPDELVLSGDNLINVEIEGRALRLEVRPDAAGAPTVNPAVAQRLGFKPGMFGFIINIGPTKVMADSAVHKIGFGGKPEKQRILWATRDVSTIADGTISPSSLPYKRVTFQLNTTASSERSYRYALDNFGFLGRVGIGTTIAAQDKKMQVIFSLIRDQNLVSAPTGNWLASNYQGAFNGAAMSTVIYYGVERPTRPMALASPLVIGDLALSNVSVRVSDYGDASGIVEQSTATGPTATDDQEIVVTGKNNKDIDLRVTVGKDVLNRCSSLTYNLDKREIRMSCGF